MVARGLPSLLVLCGTLLVSGKDVHLGELLNNYLGRIDQGFALQNLSVAALGGYMDLTGECKDISFGAVNATDNNFTLDVNVTGLGVDCNVFVDVRLNQPSPLGVPGFNMTIDILLDNAWLNFPFQVPPVRLDDDDPALLLPEKIVVDSDTKTCTGGLHGDHNISIGGLPEYLDQTFILSIEAIILDPTTFCALVNDGLEQLPAAIWIVWILPSWVLSKTPETQTRQWGQKPLSKIQTATLPRLPTMSGPNTCKIF
jgi:hypothetical protein